MPWKECSVMDERLQFVAHAGFDLNCGILSISPEDAQRFFRDSFLLTMRCMVHHIR
jgi:hypothetical protein